MIDSGASKHMTEDLYLLKNTGVISPIIIDLPSGDQTIAIKQGSVALGSLVLSDVFYVPKLSCNLISAARVSIELNCIVTFFDDFCVL